MTQRYVIGDPPSAGAPRDRCGRPSRPGRHHAEFAALAAADPDTLALAHADPSFLHVITFATVHDFIDQAQREVT